MAEDINRLKLILVEKKKTSKWLADELGVNPSTVSKWCTNSSQPDLATVLKITDLLEIDIKELIVREYDAFLLEAPEYDNLTPSIAIYDDRIEIENKQI